MREYETDAIRRKLERGGRFVLVDTLPAASYRHRHLPGAVSLPLEDLVERAAEVLPDRDAEIVTYCSGPL